MKLKVQWTSGPSHQTYHDGKPCDRYVGTVHLTGAEYGHGWMRRTYTIVGKTPDAVEKKLNQYQWEDVIDIPADKLDPVPQHKKDAQ